MKVEIPNFNYTTEQLNELEEIINSFSFQFDTPETRNHLNYIITNKVNEYILENRDKKIIQIIDDTKLQND